ncbi:MAG TPA: alanine--tRNA ligase [Acidimicrobiales bacterium]|nr:alanine--tRNA ligase [Acidimicrobiales bacterium]
MMDANQLRSTFTGFYAERGHTVVPSASLIPHDPTVLFTIAGMVPFKPYFTGEETPPWPRATSVQKCFRTVDIDIIGTTERHCTFFEMLGNFSFGDYFKSDAIPLAWELWTEVLGIDPDRLWVTVHESDDEAKEIWLDAARLSEARIQALGEDNFWQMGDGGTGPCGPSSELFFDRGPAYGDDGGPAHGGAERFVEIYNLVFMQYNRLSDGTLEDLPGKSIDTGAGLERNLPMLQGVGSLFETDVFRPILAVAEDITEVRYGADPHSDVSLRILADHARAMAMVVADGVMPSNEGRGYVLRRVIRRAVRRGFQLGVIEGLTPRLVRAVADVLGGTYSVLVTELDRISETVEREEGAFRRTLDSGSQILEEALRDGTGRVSGEAAFRLHDTHGFPIELTMEMAAEAGVEVDTVGFEREMAAQRDMARADARRRRQALGDENAYRELLGQSGPTRFTGYEHDEEPARVVAVLAGAEPGTAEIVLDQTPFYAESGGQVGDTGVITTESGRARVLDTQSVLPGLIVHRAVVEEGELFPLQDALAVIDVGRRNATRRHHTGTHLLHSALRAVLGDHVRQQGSLVAPDRLRFDFSHPKALRPEELSEVTEAANADVLTDASVEVTETSKAEAEALGALAFFDDKYGERVRVVRAGAHSLEFCGGTHVDALGKIGPITVVSEGSIGSNVRRIEAVTGPSSLALLGESRRMVDEAARLLKVEPGGVLDALQKVLDRQRQAEKELQRMHGARLQEDAARLAQLAENGVVVHRQDGVNPDQLRDLAQAIRRQGARVVVVAGSPGGPKVGVAVASGDGSIDAGATVKALAQLVGGGGGGSAELAVAGGSDPTKIDALLSEARRRLGA